MAFLSDRDIWDLLQREDPVVSGLGETIAPFGPASQVQASSIDLRIGDIYLPETSAEALGGVDNPRGSHSLLPGRTAVVSTAETLNFPKDLGAFGFPPSRVSGRGLLMTNPGHVDPGYKGKMTFTVINMGRLPYELQRDNPIVSLLLFRLPQEVEGGYTERYGERVGKPVSEERLDRLSADFLNIEERAQRIAKGEERKTRLWSIAAPVIVGLLTLLGLYLQTAAQLDQRFRELEGRLQEMQTSLSVVDERVDITGLEERVGALEAVVPTAQP